MSKTTPRSRVLLRTALGTCLFMGATPVFASPSGGSVINGNATINQSIAGQTTVTQTSNRAVINWSGGFNIANGESFEAIQPDATSILLNRDASGSLSNIDGSLTANGRVWIINPQGIAFGSNARVNVGGLLASTLDVDDSDFMDGDEDYHLARSGSLNLATISAADGAQLLADGTVAFVSSHLAFDSGSTVTSGGQAIFGTGSDVYLKFVQARDDDLDLFSFVANGQTAISTTEFDDPMALSGRVEAQQVYAVALDRTNGSSFINILGTLVANGADSDGEGGILLSHNGGGVTAPSTLGDGWFDARITSFYHDEADDTYYYGGVQGDWLSVASWGYQGASSDYQQTSSEYNSIREIRYVDSSIFDFDNFYNGSTIFNAPSYISSNVGIWAHNGSLTVNGDINTGYASLAANGDLYLDSIYTNGENIGSVRLTTFGGSIDVSGDLIGKISRSSPVASKVSIQTYSSSGSVHVGGLISATNVTIDANNASVTLEQSADVQGGTYTLFASEVGGYTLAPTFANGQGAALVIENDGSDIFEITDLNFNGDLELNGGQFLLRNISFSNLDADVSSVSSLALSGTISATNFGITTSSLTQTDGSLSADAITLVSPNSFATYDLSGDNVLTGAAILSVTSPYGTSLVFNNVGTTAMAAELNVGPDYFDASDTEEATLALDTSSDLTLTGDATFAAGANIRASGNLALTGSLDTLDADAFLAAGGRLTVSGLLSAQNAVIEATGLTNTTGANAVTVDEDGGHWVIYLASPEGNTYGNLDSGQTALWNASQSSNAADTISGNRYVFDYSPTLTVTPASLTKTYGDAIDAADIAISITGIQKGVVGAYLGDSAATAYSGAASTSSAGFAADADVGTGSYSITVDTETLSALNGYQLSLTSGLLTVDPKALSAIASVSDKTYDGTTNASGLLSLSGILFDDEVIGSATYAFADKNAGTDKAVSVTGLGLTGADAGNYTLSAPTSVTASITPKALVGTSTIDTKVYDGTTSATGSVALDGLIAGDVVSINGVNFAFADKNAGTGKLVNVTGGSLNGADAGNYTLDLTSSATGTITQRSLTAAISVEDKTYDGTTTATGAVSGLTGLVSGDDVTAGGATYTFGSKNAGSDLLVTATGLTLSGNDAGNYVLSGNPQALASILAKSLTASIAVSDKTYDGSAEATGSVTGLTGVVEGDDVTAGGATYAFADKNAGTDKAVSITGLTLTGSDAGNYVLTVPTGLTASILQKALTGSVSVDDKTYDGTTDATGSVSLAGVVTGDDVGTSGAVFTFSDKNAGTDKLVAITGVSLTGEDAGNYTLSLPDSVRAAILQRMATILIEAQSKTYDGTTSATGQVSGVTNLVTGDDVSVSGGSYTFADKNAATGKTVTGSDFVISGGDAGNYTFNLTASAFADILKKALTASISVADKTYDGSTTANGEASLAGVVIGDDVTSTEATYAFADKNAGTDKAVSVTGLGLTGADAGNYTLSAPTSVTASILPRELTITIDDASKMEGTLDPAFSYAITDGELVAGDAVTGEPDRDAGEAVGTYAIGSGSLHISENYDLTFIDGLFTIVKRPSSLTISEPALTSLAEVKLTSQKQGSLTHQSGECSTAGDDCFTVTEE